MKRWIDAGAEWPRAGASAGAVAHSEMVVTDEDRKHWSFLPLERPPLPAVKNAKFVRTPVDRFILGALEAKGLALSPQADGRKLVRRFYFDLIGLPPAPEQVESGRRGKPTRPQHGARRLTRSRSATTKRI